MASPSRSGSVASKHAVGVGGGLFQLFYQLLLAFYNAVFGLEVVLHVHAETRLGRSRTWPIEAITSYSLPRYF